MAYLDEFYDVVSKWQEERLAASKLDTDIRIWDGNWNLLASVAGEYEHSFRWEENDTGSATIQIPIDHWVCDLLIDEDKWPTKSIYFTFDKDGARWSGRVESKKVVFDSKGGEHLEFTMVHDYQKMKDLLVWANPFLPAAVQFPKSWMLFGPTKWVIATTLQLALVRKHRTRWRIPGDPMRRSGWGGLDQSSWNMVVKPVDIGSDKSIPTVINSRFKTFHECVRHAAADARISIQCRRWLKGDPPPWPGANLRHGCLVVDVVDKSGLDSGTGIKGSTRTGILHAIRRIASDGLTESWDTIERVQQPAEYGRKGYKGTVASAPWVVLDHGPYSNIETSEYEYNPPGPSQFVTGGSSMPFVNEGIKAAITGLGGLLGSLFFGQSQIGSVAATILEPLYSDVFLAFMTSKDTQRAAAQGWDFPFEKWVDGADKAYTLSAIVAMRKAKEETREKHSCKVTMMNGSPYLVGEAGFGDFFIGDRVACHALGMPEDKLFLESVSALEYRSSDKEKGWEIELGQPEFDSGFSYLVRQFENFTAGMRELGVW